MGETIERSGWRGKSKGSTRGRGNEIPCQFGMRHELSLLSALGILEHNSTNKTKDQHLQQHKGCTRGKLFITYQSLPLSNENDDRQQPRLLQLLLPRLRN